MIIPINENWQVKTDKYQWICQKKSVHKETKEVTWSSETYHPTLKAAIDSLAERLLRDSDAHGIKEAMQAAEGIAETLKKALMQ